MLHVKQYLRARFKQLFFSFIKLYINETILHTQIFTYAIKIFEYVPYVRGTSFWQDWKYTMFLSITLYSLTSHCQGRS